MIVGGSIIRRRMNAMKTIAQDAGISVLFSRNAALIAPATCAGRGRATAARLCWPQRTGAQRALNVFYVQRRSSEEAPWRPRCAATADASTVKPVNTASTGPVPSKNSWPLSHAPAAEETT